MKIKFSSDDDVTFGKILSLLNMRIDVRYNFQEDKKYYQIIFLDECFHEL